MSHNSGSNKKCPNINDLKQNLKHDVSNHVLSLNSAEQLQARDLSKHESERCCPKYPGKALQNGQVRSCACSVQQTTYVRRGNCKPCSVVMGCN